MLETTYDLMLIKLLIIIDSNMLFAMTYNLLIHFIPPEKNMLMHTMFKVNKKGQKCIYEPLKHLEWVMANIFASG